MALEAPSVRTSAEGERCRLRVVLACDERLRAKARYTLDTLLMAAGIVVEHAPEPPATGEPWLLYGPAGKMPTPSRCFHVEHAPAAWRYLDGASDGIFLRLPSGAVDPFPTESAGARADSVIAFDLVAAAFYFLSCWAERSSAGGAKSRSLYAESVFVRHDVPMDVVDRYLQALLQGLESTCGLGPTPPTAWPGGASYAVVLSHDVDFLSVNRGEVWTQAARTLARHLLRQRDLGAGASGLGAFVTGQIRGRDVFCPLDEIMRRERAMGVSSSFQVAVARSHPSDVNYNVRDPRVRERLRGIVDAGFDLAIHGSLASTSSLEAYAGEVEVLAEQIARPLGSRQHFLSFDPDVLFLAQERSGIEYDMSLGFPDHTGNRAGFSFPFFPFCVAEDRPYDVVQIGLVAMDVTLRTYMALSNQQAREEVDLTLERLRRMGGCASVVWHPIVFGGARDPGMDDIFWHLVERVLETGGLATDGATINTYWRSRGHAYESFRHVRESSSCASKCQSSGEASATGARTPAVAAPPQRVQE